MADLIATSVAVISLALTLLFASIVVRLNRRINELERALRSTPRPALPASPDSPRPLAGLRIALAAKQDYAHPVFEKLVKELLLSEDVAEINSLAPEEAAQLQTDWEPGGPDIIIAGEIIGNGYAEVYYQAEFTCYAAHGAVCTVIERPPNGDRPSNLALEVVNRLKTELDKHLNRDDRRRAIRELHLD